MRSAPEYCASPTATRSARRILTVVVVGNITDSSCIAGTPQHVTSMCDVLRVAARRRPGPALRIVTPPTARYGGIELLLLLLFPVANTFPQGRVKVWADGGARPTVEGHSVASHHA